MTTYLELQEKVSRALSDEGHQTFSVAVVKDMISASWAEIGRWFPRRFQEDLTAIADTLTYPILADDFPDGNDDIEVQRVEVWITTTTPNKAWRLVEGANVHPMGLTYSQAGWKFWGGTLELPNRVEEMIDPTQHNIRVWGYAPYAPLVTDDDVSPLTAEKEEFVVLLAFIEGLRRLTGSRVLFKQWQTRSNNTDITMASLLNDLNVAQEEWRRKQRSAIVLREG